MNEIDETGQGMKESYERYLAIIVKRYGIDMSPKEVVKKLIGCDISRVDDEGAAGSSAAAATAAVARAASRSRCPGPSVAPWAAGARLQS